MKILVEKNISGFLAIFSIIICFSLVEGASAVDFSEIEKGIFSLEIAKLRVLAVEDDMNLSLRKSMDKSGQIKSAQQAIKDLNKIEGILREIDFPKEIYNLKTEFDDVIEKLKAVYSGIEGKSDERIKEDFNLFWTGIEIYSRNLKEFIDGNLNLPELPGDFDIRNLEKDFLSANDKIIFGQILQAMNERRYKEAYGQLEGMLSRYKGSIFEGSIISRMVDCCEMKNSEIEKGLTTNGSIALLNKFIESGTYSFRLYRIFEQWRTLKQLFNNGMSNWSVIPNKDYINKRRTVIQNLEKYLGNNPDDAWAKWQIVLLMNLPIIQRGGAFGNTNIRHWIKLFDNDTFMN